MSIDVLSPEGVTYLKGYKMEVIGDAERYITVKIRNGLDIYKLEAIEDTLGIVFVAPVHNHFLFRRVDDV